MHRKLSALVESTRGGGRWVPLGSWPPRSRVREAAGGGRSHCCCPPQSPTAGHPGHEPPDQHQQQRERHRGQAGVTPAPLGATPRGTEVPAAHVVILLGVLACTPRHTGCIVRQHLDACCIWAWLSRPFLKSPSFSISTTELY